MGCLLEGQSINVVAKKYNLPRGTVASWATRERNAMRGDDSMLNGDQRERVGHLVIDNVEAMLETTKKILNVCQDEEWLREQSATEIGVLFGIISDKTYRLLEALPDGEPESVSEDSGGAQ